jgi:hypothetical protein
MEKHMKTRKELEVELNVSGTHYADIHKLFATDLLELIKFGYQDCSWKNNECASFISPCEKYEIFVDGEHTHGYMFSVAYICEDGERFHNGGTNSIYEAINWICTDGVFYDG